MLNTQDLLLVLSFASKSAEMLEGNLSDLDLVNIRQWQALSEQVRKVLAEFDRANPTLLPLPHDGIAWADRDALAEQER